uniref:Uncharacterized protein n=1 Tax=Knipowitschia caucasica TaxID=637954 RepID=A0AAV2MET4_KNICA
MEEEEEEEEEARVLLLHLLSTDEEQVGGHFHLTAGAESVRWCEVPLTPRPALAARPPLRRAPDRFQPD